MEKKKTGSVRERILDVAIRMFAQNGYHGTTLDEIIAAANIGKGTIYRHFGNKEDLYQALIIEINGKLMRQIQEVSLLGDSFEDLKTRITAFVEFFVEHPDYFFVRLQHVASVKESSRRFLIDQTHKFFADTETELRAKGCLGKLKQYPLFVYSSVIFSVLNGFLFQFLHSGKQRPSDEEIHMITDIIANGIFDNHQEQTRK